MSSKAEILSRAEQYAQQHGFVIYEQLGFGVHGTVFAAECQFGAKKWREVQSILRALEGYGIFLVDVTPNNIAWRPSSNVPIRS